MGLIQTVECLNRLKRLTLLLARENLQRMAGLWRWRRAGRRREKTGNAMGSPKHAWNLETAWMVVEEIFLGLLRTGLSSIKFLIVGNAVLQSLLWKHWSSLWFVYLGSSMLGSGGFGCFWWGRGMWYRKEEEPLKNRRVTCKMNQFSGCGTQGCSWPWVSPRISKEIGGAVLFFHQFRVLEKISPGHQKFRW